MRSLSYKKLNTLRSGQTVWRVWGYADQHGKVEIEVVRYIVLGKKIRTWFEKTNEYAHSSLKMKCKRAEVEFSDPGCGRRENRAVFLSDLHGLGCFPSLASATRFANDIREGRHPDIIQRLIESEADDRVFNYFFQMEMDEEY